MHGGTPARGWRRGAAGKVWPVVLELSVATACSGGYLVRRDAAAEPGSYGGGGVERIEAMWPRGGVNRPAHRI
jgi:hypothetical protein